MTREETIRKTLDAVLWTRSASDDNKNILTDALVEALEQEPKIGHWIVAKGSYLGMRNACCSNCKDFYTNDWNAMNYCPNCGADMREVEE